MKSLFFVFAGLLLLAGATQATLNPDEAIVVEELLTAWPVLSTYGWVAGSAADACGPPMPWAGLTCDETNSTITGIWFASTALNAAIPDSIAHLSNLSSLQLDACSLTGAIPETLGDLGQLAVLNLASNGLTGTVPASLAALTYQQLSTLILTGNQLELCGNPALNGSSISPGILQCNVSDQVPEPCGCPGIWNLCLDSDIGNCSAPEIAVPEVASPDAVGVPQVTAPETGVPSVTVPETDVPSVTVPESAPTVIITPQAPTPSTVPTAVPSTVPSDTPSATPSTTPSMTPSTPPTAAPSVTPTGNAPRGAASSTAFSIPLMVLATALLAVISTMF